MNTPDIAPLRCLRRPPGPLLADPAAAPWSGIPATALRDTVTGLAPAQATELRIVWNERELRVLFVIHDDDVWSTLTGRDDPLYNEEVVEVFLDPSGGLGSYYEFEVNPVNAVLDLVVRREGTELRKDFQWRCPGLQTAVRRTAGGWNAEFAIPFAGLGAAPGPKPWRANFYRIDRPANAPWELSAWSPTGVPRFHVAERFGALEFGE